MHGPSLRSFVLVLIALLSASLRAQNYTVAQGSGTGCGGVVYDSGGEGASGYQNGEDYTFTICPDIPGNVIYLTFFYFDLNTSGPGPIDNLTIYDGDNTGETLLGSYTGTQLQNIIVSGTVFNTSGCLTLVFHSNANGTGVFAAGYQCTTPCEHPTAVASMSEAAPALVCVGEEVQFDGSASTAVSGFSIVQYRWEFDDGTVDSTSGPVVSHAFPGDGEYVVQLTITDDNDCRSLNLVDLQVLVSTTPTFAETWPSVETCFGETVMLYGQGDPVTWTGMPDVNLGDGVFLPDDVGLPFTSTLLFEQFDPGQTVTSTSDILSICLDLEHTWMGDLVLQVICPNGQTTILHQQGGDGTYLGSPNDFDSDVDPILGECWHYCWSPTATNGTWIENLSNTTVAGEPPSGSLNPGTYESVQPFTNLIGCPLNGTWTFQSTDLWAIDNGFICDWEMNFNPAIIPDVTQFTPTIGAGTDSSRWNGGTVPDYISANGDTLLFTATAPGVYPFIYTVTDNFGCSYDTTITVTVDEPFVVDAGTNVVICNDPVQLDATVTGAPTACNWVLEMNDSWGDGWNGAQLTISVNGTPTTYTLFSGTEESVSIPVMDGDAIALSYSVGSYEGEVSYTLFGDGGNTIFSDGPYPLSGSVFSGTVDCQSGEPLVVWSWSPAAGLSDAGVPDPMADVSSTTVFTLSVSLPGHPACQASDAVTVTMDPGADPGLDSLVVICPNAPAFQMIDMLGGTPAAGGTWADASGNPVGGSFDPQSDPAGIFTYSVTSAMGCIGVAELEVQVLAATDPLCCGGANAGTDGALSVCSNGAPADLFAQLGGTPGANGTWTDPSGSPSNGTFTPGISTGGVYTYTVPNGANCPPASATVTVSVAQAVDAGEDGSIALCENGPTTDLFTLLGGSPDAGGSWLDPAGGTSTGSFVPGTSLGGIYVYQVAGIAPCPSDQANVNVTVALAPDAGTNGSLSLCTTDDPVDLLGVLGGTPDTGGTWTDPNGVSANGILTPATALAGPYTYSIAGVAPCPSAQAIVDVSIAAPPNAGIDGGAILCISSPAVALADLLSGTPDPGGSWSFNGAPHGPMIDPAVDLPGDYTYTVTGSAFCPSASALVSVIITSSPDAGTNGAIVACTSGPPVDLFAQLGGSPDGGGIWSGPSVVVNGVFDPAQMSAGAYTYTLTVPPPCVSASSQVIVDLVSPAEAGSDSSLTLCSLPANVDLFDLLGGSAAVGGSWSDPLGNVHDGVFDPANDIPGGYAYTVSSAVPCPSDAAVVTLAVVDPPVAGADAQVSLCESGGSVDLFLSLVGAEPFGTWLDPQGAAFSGVFVPGIGAPGNYTYTVNNGGPCPADEAIITVAIASDPNAGTDADLTLCSDMIPQALFTALGGNPEAGGSWIGPGGTPSNGQFDPAVHPPGAYAYVLATPPPCLADTAWVQVALVPAPFAGTDGNMLLCAQGAVTDLFTALGGSFQAGGSWTGPDGLAHLSTIDPTADDAGTYTYTVAGIPPCASDVALVTVQIGDPIAASAIATDATCNGSCDGMASLQLAGDASGYLLAWPDNIAGSADTVASGLCIGTYLVGITDSIGCTGTVQFTIAEPPPVQVDQVISQAVTCAGDCNGTIRVIDDGAETYSLDNGLTWQSLAAFTELCAGDYAVLVQDASGCTALVTATVAAPPPVLADFSTAPDTVTLDDPTVHFTDQSTNAQDLHWIFAGLGTSTERDPSFSFPNVVSGEYEVCLQASNAAGCADTLCRTIVVLDVLLVHVPNAFSPNDDGINEGFKPVFNLPGAVEDYEFMVFDRWGELIFESHEVKEGWDGRVGGAEPKTDVYVWKLRVRDAVSKLAREHTGSVTVLN